VDAPAALIAALEDESAQQSQSSPNAADFARVRDWLRKQDRSAFIGKMRQLSSWSARISRYSFGSEAGDAVRYTPISSAAGPPTQPAPAGTPPAGPSPRRRRPAPRETPRVP